jgi:hypothetical protein
MFSYNDVVATRTFLLRSPPSHRLFGFSGCQHPGDAVLSDGNAYVAQRP